MKKIRLAVAQRYLRRTMDTGAQIECAYREGETPERDLYPSLFLGHQLRIVIVFTPKSESFFEARRHAYCPNH